MERRMLVAAGVLLLVAAQLVDRRVSGQALPANIFNALNDNSGNNVAVDTNDMCTMVAVRMRKPTDDLQGPRISAVRGYDTSSGLFAGTLWDVRTTEQAGVNNFVLDTDASSFEGVAVMVRAAIPVGQSGRGGVWVFDGHRAVSPIPGEEATRVASLNYVSAAGVVERAFDLCDAMEGTPEAATANIVCPLAMWDDNSRLSNEMIHVQIAANDENVFVQAPTEAAGIDEVVLHVFDAIELVWVQSSSPYSRPSRMQLDPHTGLLLLTYSTSAAVFAMDPSTLEPWELIPNAVGIADGPKGVGVDPTRGELVVYVGEEAVSESGFIFAWPLSTVATREATYLSSTTSRLMVVPHPEPEDESSSWIDRLFRVGPDGMYHVYATVYSEEKEILYHQSYVMDPDETDTDFDQRPVGVWREAVNTFQRGMEPSTGARGRDADGYYLGSVPDMVLDRGEVLRAFEVLPWKCNVVDGWSGGSVPFWIGFAIAAGVILCCVCGCVVGCWYFNKWLDKDVNAVASTTTTTTTATTATSAATAATAENETSARQQMELDVMAADSDESA